MFRNLTKNNNSDNAYDIIKSMERWSYKGNLGTACERVELFRRVRDPSPAVSESAIAAAFRYIILLIIYVFNNNFKRWLPSYNNITDDIITDIRTYR